MSELQISSAPQLTGSLHREPVHTWVPFPSGAQRTSPYRHSLALALLTHFKMFGSQTISSVHFVSLPHFLSVPHTWVPLPSAEHRILFGMQVAESLVLVHRFVLESHSMSRPQLTAGFHFLSVPHICVPRPSAEHRTVFGMHSPISVLETHIHP